MKIFTPNISSHGNVIRHVLCALAGLLLIASMSVNAQGAWQPTKTRAYPPGTAVPQARLSANEPVDIVVGLKLRNREKLNALIESLTTPGNPQFRKWLSHKGVVSSFSPTPDQALAVANYLADTGFSNVIIEPNYLLITATGTADAVRRAFNTDLVHFIRNGRDAIANTSDVQVPAALGDIVESVLGLQTLDQAHIVTVTTHNPVQWPTIYSGATIATASKTVVGIVTEGSMTQTTSDLHTFEANNSLPTITPTVVNIGGTSSDTSGTEEWDLDSQDIQGMAGGSIGGMIFYTSVSLTNAALADTYNKVVIDNLARVINVSLEECETSAFSDGSMATDDAVFATAVAQGQTFAVASGDQGSRQCGTGGVNGSSYGSITADSYPASSPYVIAVGGTTLSTDAGGGYSSETAWSFSGGGPSLYEPMPSWQIGTVSGTKRGVPDIAFDADPNSGAAFIFNGSGKTNGGTSLAAPLFAGAWARIESEHNNVLGFPGAWFYKHGINPASPLFHDITSGSNGDNSATTGWDFVTGFGSLDVAAVSAADNNTTWLPAVVYLLGT